MSGDEMKPGQAQLDDEDETPVVDDEDVDGLDDTEEADDAADEDPSPKTDVPGESDEDEGDI